MGSGSSQPATQEPRTEEKSQLFENTNTRQPEEQGAGMDSKDTTISTQDTRDNDVDMQDLPVNKTPDSTRHRDGRLKTYARKGAASTARKPRRTRANPGVTPNSAHNRQPSVELGDAASTQPPASTAAAVAAADETPVQAKASRKGSKKRKNPATGEALSAKTPTRRSRRKQADTEVPESDHEVEAVPESDHEGEARAGAEPEEDVEAEPEDEQGEEVDEIEAEPEEPEEPEEAERDEKGDYELPPDSNGEEQSPPPPPPPPQQRAVPKRKRGAEEHTSSPAPSAKRQKTSTKAKSSRKSQASMLDYPEQGPFTPVEMEIIENVVLEYCKDHALSREQLVEKIHSASKDMTPVYVHIANDVLPNRQRRAVQRYCRRHYNNYQRGKWTEEQDDLLRNAFAVNPNKWVPISAKVGRMPEDCRDRWRNHLVHGDNRNTDVWTEDEELKLVTIVRDCLKALEEKTGIEINRENEDDYIAWSVVVQKMKGTRNRLQCSMKWRKIKARVEKEESAQKQQEAGGGSGAAAAAKPRDDADFGASSPISSRYKAEAQRRYEDMSIGDIYGVAKEIQYGALMGSFATKNTFWAVVTRLHPASPWNTQDRKMVYKRLRPNIVDTGDFAGNVEAEVKWLESNFEKEALETKTVGRVQGVSHTGAVGKRGSFRSKERVSESDDDDEMEGVDATATAAATAPASGAQDSKVVGSVGDDGGDAGVEEDDDDDEDEEEERFQTPEAELDAKVAASPHVSESEESEDEDSESSDS